MIGSATFTTATSSTTMNCPRHASSRMRFLRTGGALAVRVSGTARDANGFLCKRLTTG